MCPFFGFCEVTSFSGKSGLIFRDFQLARRLVPCSGVLPQTYSLPLGLAVDLLRKSFEAARRALSGPLRNGSISALLCLTFDPRIGKKLPIAIFDVTYPSFEMNKIGKI